MGLKARKACKEDAEGACACFDKDIEGPTVAHTLYSVHLTQRVAGLYDAEIMGCANG